MDPRVTQLCLGLIHQFEGSGGTFEPTRTTDPAGNYEIGWSHKLSGPDDPLWFATLDQDQADGLALEDLQRTEAGIVETLGGTHYAALSPGQCAALIDFAYNEGVGKFAGSTLCHFIMVGAMHLVPAEFGKWVFGNVDGREQVLDGLVRRRAAEVAIWNL